MACVEFEGAACALEENESVLDGLLRRGHKIPHSCKAGICGSCLLRATSGRLPERAQSGLKESWKRSGYFLACVCRPESDLTVSRVGADVRVPATIAGLRPLGANVVEVRLATAHPLEFHAGQYVTVVRGDGLARSYSISSTPDERDLVLHVRRIAGGKMSNWLHHEAKVGESVEVLGPSGECFYVPGREEQPLLLVGAGTGLAPLWGIARDALRHGHRGPIHLFHGAVQASGLYLVRELRQLANEYPQLEYIPTVLEGEGDGMTVGALDQVVAQRFPKLGGYRGFLCGDPALVASLKRKMFLSGMASRDIHCDAFTPAAD